MLLQVTNYHEPGACDDWRWTCSQGPLCHLQRGLHRWGGETHRNCRVILAGFDSLGSRIKLVMCNYFGCMWNIQKWPGGILTKRNHQVICLHLRSRSCEMLQTLQLVSNGKRLRSTVGTSVTCRSLCAWNLVSLGRWKMILLRCM